MNVMSFNTQSCFNYLEQRTDFEIMAQSIMKCGADVVGLNEMLERNEISNLGTPRSVLSELTGLKYHYFAQAIDHPKVGLYGNAILSRYPIISAETISIPDPVVKNGTGYYEHRCVLKARLENGITFVISHFGLNPDEQTNAVKTVLECIEDEKCILMGDFNVTDENEILNPIRERMTDTATYFDGLKLSFPSDKPRCKIDYIFTSHDLKVVCADIPEIVASDHRPHTATIEV